MKEGGVRTNFLPVDLACHADLCVAFAEDMDLCSFGSAEQFHGPDGKGAERYLARMREKLSADPDSCLHAWLDGEIVGQMNLGRFIDPSVGYISVFYVVPGWRGMSVAPSNVRAVRFYLRCGWRDLGPRVDKPELHNMEKIFQ